jgi:hypothetical protein
MISQRYGVLYETGALTRAQYHKFDEDDSLSGLSKTLNHRPFTQRLVVHGLFNPDEGRSTLFNYTARGPNLTI